MAAETGKLDHLEILDMIARGMFGSPETLPQKLSEWPQVRPALLAAIAEIEAARGHVCPITQTFIPTDDLST